MALRALVLGIIISCVEGEECQAGSCLELAGEAEELVLLQRRARSFQVNRSEAQDAATGRPGTWSPKLSLATTALEIGISELGLARNWSRQAAAGILGVWLTTFLITLSWMLHSVLVPSTRVVDRQDVGSKEKKSEETILGTAWSMNVFHCLSFTWMDSFLAAAGPQLQMKPGPASEPRKVASWWKLLRVPRPVALISCAWLVAFLELVAMVLILDALLLMYDHRHSSWSGPQGPLQVILAVLCLLFVVPLIYRYFSALLLMMENMQTAMITRELTSMLYQKALRLPIGDTYRHPAQDERIAGWQVAKDLVDGIVQEGPLMIRTLALFTAAPFMACLLLLLLVFHLGFLGLLGLMLLLPGALLAGLLVKCGISSRKDYQRWHQELLRCQGLQSVGSDMKEQIMHARHCELIANQWYSVLMALLAGTLHAVVWLVMVASLYWATRKGHISARNLWLMLQMVTSLQACAALLFSGAKRAWSLPKALQRIDCFLEQPEMPRDVVRSPPMACAPAARISGSFSFEEGGPTVLHDLDFSVQRGECVAVTGQANSGKSALLLALLGELFPCGLACVSSTAQRCFLKGEMSTLLEPKLEGLELLLWDEAPEAELESLKAMAKSTNCALLVVLDRAVGRFDRVLQLHKGRCHGEVNQPAQQDFQAAQMAPLKLLGDALKQAVEEAGCVTPTRTQLETGSQDDTAEGSLWNLALAFLGTAGAWNVLAVLLLVLLQRSAQLLQFLFLASWSDVVAVNPVTDHNNFAVSIVISVLLNMLLLTLSDWAASCLATRAGLHLQSRQLLSSSNGLDSVIAGCLAFARSVVGSLLQQTYILLIAPQWLAVTVLLPAYLCVVFFAWIYLRAAVLLALKGEACFREAQQILNESLDPDPVVVRANHLQRKFLQAFNAEMAAMTGFNMLLSGSLKSWLSFRVTFCVAFAVAACALQVLLCDHEIGVGTLGLVISLLFSLTSDVELACESCVQGCRGLGALQRSGAFPATCEAETMEVAKEQTH